MLLLRADSSLLRRRRAAPCGRPCRLPWARSLRFCASSSWGVIALTRATSTPRTCQRMVEQAAGRRSEIIL